MSSQIVIVHIMRIEKDMATLYDINVDERYIIVRKN